MTDSIAATVEAVRDVHPDIRIIRIRPNGAPVSWLAGQYMELVFAGLPARPYSIANAPHNDVLEFHIRRAGSGGVSDHAVRNLKHGDTLALRGPFGKAAMVAGNALPLLLVAGGVGLPPLKALIDDSLHKNLTTPITLYWGVRTGADLYLGQYFTDLEKTHPHFKFVPVIQDQAGQTVGDAIEADNPDLSQTRIYLAGSEAMIAAILPQLYKRGADPDFIHGDDRVLNQPPKTNTGPA